MQGSVTGGIYMLYKAVTSFCGGICAAKGDLLDLRDKAVIKDLTKAGYIVKAESADEVSDDENVGNNAE